MNDAFDVDKFLRMADSLPFATMQIGKPETQKAMRDAAAEINNLRNRLSAWKAEGETWRSMPHLDHIRGSYWETDDCERIDKARAATDVIEKETRNE